MARLLYPDIGDCRALVIDGNMTSRSILAGMLRAMGVGHVAYASRATDARRLLENRTFDVVLCDYHFDHSAMSGQDLLDDLRRSNLLPYATVFVMVTGEASYTRVAEAAEAALDSYLSQYGAPGPRIASRAIAYPAQSYSYGYGYPAGYSYGYTYAPPPQMVMVPVRTEVQQQVVVRETERYETYTVPGAVREIPAPRPSPKMIKNR